MVHLSSEQRERIGSRSLKNQIKALEKKLEKNEREIEKLKDKIKTEK